MILAQAAALAGLVGLLGGCLPQTGGSSGGPGAGGGAAPSGASSVATAGEIDRYVRGGSAYVEHYSAGVRTNIECGYFGSSGSYESAVFELDDYEEYSWDWTAQYAGRWSVEGSRLCFSGSYFNIVGFQFPPPDVGNGCYAAEWSTTGDALLLINGRDGIEATIITGDGRAQYQRACDL